MTNTGESDGKLLSFDVHIVTFHSDRCLLKRTLEALAAQTNLGVVRVLANDGDTRGLAELLQELGIAGEVILAERNLGFCGGHNMLLKVAFGGGTRHVVILNPDLVLRSGALRTVAHASAVLPPQVLLSGILLLGDRNDRDNGHPLRIDSRGTRWTRSGRHLDVEHGELWDGHEEPDSFTHTAAISGAFIAVSSEAYGRICFVSGGEFFDEDFFAYREDAELGIRAAQAGVPSLIQQVVLGTHYRGSPGVTRMIDSANKYSVRNRYLLAMKYGWLARPGNLLLTLGRDIVVAIAVATVERKSFGGLIEAYRLRSRMIQKRHLLKSRLAVEQPSP